MRPNDIKEIQGRIYGGEAKGMYVIYQPTTLKEVAMFFSELQECLTQTGARMAELNLINAEGAKELRCIYAKTTVVEADPWNSFNTV